MSIHEEYRDLPPRFGRAAVDTFFPGIVSSKTLAKWDSEGKGPEVRYRFRRAIVYEKKSFLDWLEKDFMQLKKV